jgi:cell wall-associated NlpC family hydrolase
LESISKAVASNAGSVGRQAAVIAAASGLVLTLGVPAQATPATREASAVPAESLSAHRVAVKTVAVAADKKFEIERAELTSTPAPAPKPVVAVVADSVNETTDGAAGAAMTRENRGASTQAATRATTRSSAAQAPTTRSSAAQAPTTRSSAPASTSRSTASTGTTTAAAPKKKATASAPSANLGGIAGIALSYKGAPYVYGGNTPSGWDCSGFVQYVYGKAGIKVARGTSAILGSGQFVRTSNPKPGDLVFQNGGGHVGIYIGGGKIIGAQNPSVGTVIREADSPYGPLMGYYTLAR